MVAAGCSGSSASEPTATSSGLGSCAFASPAELRLATGKQLTGTPIAGDLTEQRGVVRAGCAYVVAGDRGGPVIGHFAFGALSGATVPSCADLPTGRVGCGDESIGGMSGYQAGGSQPKWRLATPSTPGRPGVSLDVDFAAGTAQGGQLNFGDLRLMLASVIGKYRKAADRILSPSTSRS
jgi:hypothetical protein